jgi:hypothetical protein
MDKHSQINSDEEYKNPQTNTNLDESPRSLLFSSVGVHSKHSMWLDTKDQPQNFDVVLYYYDHDEKYLDELLNIQSETCQVVKHEGLKWPNFYHYYQSNKGIVDRYQYIWVPDDDIQMDGSQINKMFDTLKEHPEIQVCGPSTTLDSCCSLGYTPRFDKQIRGLLLQYVTFVENGLLLFKTQMLHNPYFLNLIHSAYTGYWLDAPMRYCFDESQRPTAMALLHNVAARHLNRVTSGYTSDLDKVIPRCLHSRDIDRFLSNGVPREHLVVSRTVLASVSSEEDQYTTPINIADSDK